MYVDPLSLVIRRSATPVKCRKRAPPRWKIGKEWFCGYPEIRPCNGPGSLPEHRCTNDQEKNVRTDPDPEEDMGEYQQKGEGRSIPPREALEKLSADVSRHWLGGYAGLETLPGVIGTAMLGVSAAEMMLGTAVRMSVLYAWKGPGSWMAAALWSTAFQVVIMPGRWALEWGRDQGEVIAQAMEDGLRVWHPGDDDPNSANVGGANLPLDGGGTGATNGRN